MTKRNPDLWPLKSVLNFYRARTHFLFSSKDRRFDLSDNLMGSWHHKTRTVYFGMTVDNAEWPVWDEAHVAHIETLIDRDLSFDGYKVTINRLTEGRDLACSSEFLWKLVIATAC